MSALDQYKSVALHQLDFIDSKLLENEYMQVIAAKVPKARPAYLAGGVSVFIFLFLVWGVGARFVANLVGFIYPLYQSFHSLKDGKADETDSQWLTYWVVYAVFTLIESLTDFLSNWIPLYHLVKIGFLVWCFLPQTLGALVIYRTVIEPILVRYEGHIDSASNKGRAVAGRVAADVEHEVSAEVSRFNRKLVNNAIGNLTSSAIQSNSSSNVIGHGGAVDPSQASSVEHESVEHQEGQEPKKNL